MIPVNIWTPVEFQADARPTLAVIRQSLPTAVISLICSPSFSSIDANGRSSSGRAALPIDFAPIPQF